MLAKRRIRTGEADLYKQVRLASLKDAPYAFSSTYASVLQRSAESWREQADHSAYGPDRATFIVFAGEAPIGLAALYRLPDRTGVGKLLHVWINPEYRGKGVAWNMMDAIFEWSSENDFRKMIAAIKKG